MFDPATAALVRAARRPAGLEPDALVEQLTAAYVDIAAARLALSAADDRPTPDLTDLLARMRRLADTYESYVTLDLFSEQRRSAAFVAGAARQVTARVAELRAPLDDQPSRLDDEAIDNAMAAALLFLIAEQPSDAFEAARSIRAAGGQMTPVRRALIVAVRAFCQGAFRRITDIDPEREKLGSEELYDLAADLLFRELLRGVRQLALAGLGEAGDEAIADARRRFSLVRELAVDTETVVAPDGAGMNTVSIFAGPHHLAVLLLQSSGTLSAAALVRTPSPQGANEDTWKAWLRSEAGSWPFLWPNHRACLRTGYLDQGQSLVMTTPTGSGKTTLAAMKIAATLASGRTVLYLAPTHALVGQVERDLNLRIAGIARAVSIEDISLNDVVETLPDLAVVTPERCFALLTFAPHLFANVGLLVFDEFHLLGVSRPATAGGPARIGRRGIDSMLCLLTFLTLKRDADVLLLSAMVSNGDEVAAWLKNLLGRDVQAFNDPWKPTRQLRSCVIYDQAELGRLRASMRLSSRSGLASPPVEARPYGLFSLVSGWNPGAPDKLATRPLSDGPFPLATGVGGRLTSNRGAVAARLARGFADAGLKVIVFCENIRMCSSVAAELNQGPGGAIDPQWSGQQVMLRDSLIEELGVADAAYDAGAHRAAVHHGELLRGERELVESLFRNTGSGVNVLAATSTLAQGLNLPCEIVILAGTDRLDENNGAQRTPLLPHEILNALGRAGRAGQSSTGLAVVVPASPLGYDQTNGRLSDHQVARVVFSDTDQCFPLEDPLAALFDLIEIDGVHGDEADYLLRRLSASFGERRAGVEDFETLAQKTFGFWRRSTLDPRVAQAWLEQRKKTLEGQIARLAPVPQLPWQEEFAAKTGASSAFIAALAQAYAYAPQTAIDAIDWVNWLLDQLDSSSSDFDVFLRPETLGRVFGRAYAHQIRTDGQGALRDAVKKAMAAWLSGASLTDIEALICGFIVAHEGKVKRPTRPDRHAQKARRFALRLVPDLSFLCGVLAQVAERLATEPGGTAPPPMVAFLPTLVRHGCQTPYHYVMRRSMEVPSRPAVEKKFAAVGAEIKRLPTDDWGDVRHKVNQAIAIGLFDWNKDELDALMAVLADDVAPASGRPEPPGENPTPDAAG